jgi:hypothetical protein
MASSLGDYYKLHGLIRQLFKKLPEVAVDAAVDLITTHVRTVADAQPAEDLAFLIMCSCEARPHMAQQRLLLPLLASCAEDAASEPTDGTYLLPLFHATFSFVFSYFLAFALSVCRAWCWIRRHGRVK